MKGDRNGCQVGEEMHYNITNMKEAVNSGSATTKKERTSEMYFKRCWKLLQNLFSQQIAKHLYVVSVHDLGVVQLCW